ncbi:PREDICTED: uncharacterized protein LOC107353824 [Acropora digitifera]|uniref:uncharacterized protein LOC107353824 n=1 Tax=Acropora digitifera TaxID=70779 RepID=UPI00077AAB28|nr:PREDICTED: uncharacterized protein LOC107353824 [Acropora digitifera]
MTQEESRKERAPASNDLRNNGTFRWNDDKDRLLLVEIRTVEPFKFKKNTKESGHAWAKVAEGVNQHGIFTSMPRDERSVRDRFKKLLTDCMAKMPSNRQIVGDNWDLEVKARYQTKSQNNKSLHYFHAYAVKDRVAA